MRDKNAMNYFACKFKFKNSKFASTDFVTFYKNECPKTFCSYFIKSKK